MDTKLSRRILPVILICMIALAVAVTGCKKKMPKETPPPPPPKVEEVTPPPAPDTTGQAARELQAQMDADRARIIAVYFDYDRSDIRADQRDRVSTNAEIFRRWTDWQVSVEGHCDERGTNEYNLALGERRAIAAKKALVAAGIDGARISIVSFGEERPADPGHTDAAWSKNRRAEFKVK
ncbi:peptidoglycan-associated lipoprotein Pal [candidate division KSB1 bacterium]|nr:MAG: peptidoglycan-associated lipoprotein Pal [candidate division KSB1 bacterium]RPH97032.1 MAG: peptidoglycan-associated lipoprotein Pal [candidate division KSB1 bacterium]